MQIDVRLDHLELIKNALKLHVPERKVVAFGSRVKWTAKDTSDLDLCVMGDENISFETLGALRDELSNSNLPYKVDVIDWASIKPDFRKIIEQRNEIIQLPEAKGWSYKRLSDAALINPSAKLAKNTTYPFVDMAAIEPGRKYVEPSERRLYSGGGSKFLHGDTLLARITPCLENGKIAMFKGENESDVAHGSTEFIVFRGRPEISDSEFVYYLVTSPGVRTFAINQMTGSSGRQRVPTSAFDFITVGIPPVTAQREIAAILKVIDDKIELNRLINISFERIAQALFKSWFINFDSTKNSELITIENKRVPKGWQVLPFGELLEDTIGGDWGKEVQSNKFSKEVAILRGTDFQTIKNGTRDRVPIRFVEENKYLKREIKAGDIIIEISGGSPTQPTGRSLYITEKILNRFKQSIIPASFCRRFRPKNKTLGIYLALYLDYLYTNGGTWAYQNQSTGISNFQTTHFLQSEKVVIPNKEILESFYNIILPVFEKIQSNESLSLILIRDTLLPKLISGELRVNDASSKIKEAI